MEKKALSNLTIKRTKMNLIKTVSTLFFLGFGSLIIGQDSIPLPTQNVKVVKQFQPKAADAKAIEIFPKDIKTTTLPALTMQYDIPTIEFDIDYPDPVIKPLVYEEEENFEDNKDGYAQLGYGNLASPFIESQFHYDIQDWFQTGFNVKHFSAKDETSEIFRAYSRSDAEVYASYYLTDQTKATVDVFYENQDRSLCCSGIKEFENLPSTMLDNYGVGLRIDHNSFSVKGFSTKHNIDVSRVNSRLNEESEYKYAYSSTSNKTISKKLLFNLPLTFNHFTSEEWVNNPNQFTARPNVYYKDKKLSIRGGAFVATTDSLYIRPHVEASYQFTDYNIEAKVSYVANSSVNSLHHLYEQMPFFHNAQDTLVSYARQEKISLGALYKTKKSSLYLGGFYANFNDQALFVYQESNLHERTLGNWDGFGLELNGHYALPKILTVFIEMELNGYDWMFTADSEINPTYIPPFSVNLKLVQEPIKGLNIYQRMEYQNETSALFVQDGNLFVGSIPSFVDISAGLEYLFKNKVGLYIEAGNLLNNSYQRYIFDNSFGMNFHGGLKFLF